MKKLFWPIGILAAGLLVYFVFIPAFAARLVIDPVIKLGFLNLRWYGLIMAAAILAAYFYARNQSWRFGISKQEVDNYTFWAVIFGFVGARIYYVLFDWSYFAQNLSEVYKIWHGGISIYGGLIAGIVFSFIYARRKAYSFYQLFDLVALSIPLGQAIGRFGNFFNQEAYGSPTDLPWKMAVDGRFVHPTFLYEAAIDIAIFFILRKLVGKTKSGSIGWTYLGLYSFGRFFVESLRTDSFWLSGFRVDQLVAILVLLTASAMLLKMRKD